MSTPLAPADSLNPVSSLPLAGQDQSMASSSVEMLVGFSCAGSGFLVSGLAGSVLLGSALATSAGLSAGLAVGLAGATGAFIACSLYGSLVPRGSLYVGGSSSGLATTAGSV